MEKGIPRESIVGKSKCPINSGAMNGRHPLLLMLKLTPVANGPSPLKAKVGAKVKVAQTMEGNQPLSRYGVKSVNDQDTLRTGAMTIHTDQEENLSLITSSGATHVTGLGISPVHVLPLPSRSPLKEKGNCHLKAVQESTGIGTGRVKTSLPHTTPNTPPQYSTMRRQPVQHKIGGTNLS